MSRIVVALGGNALGKDPAEQINIVKKTARRLVDLAAAGNEIIVTHGNGPQVGMIYKNMNHASTNVPFPECGAMSQGYIGYHLQQAIQAEIEKRHLRKKCITVVTQVEVNPKDPGFKNPTKPIGQFYNRETALKLAKETGDVYKEDAGRGYRRVVASPEPIKIVELNTIKKLVSNNNIIIACGGGGIPVVKKKYGYAGVDAVIDKDRTSSKLATLLDADILLILTTVETVKIHFGQKDQTALRHLSVRKAKNYVLQNEFAPGSMLPKIEACLYFVEHKRGVKAIITSLTKAKNALEGKTGTIISKEEK